MWNKCPGNLQSNIKAEIIKCRGCGYDVEIFSDEISRKCPKCKAEVTREKLPSCIDWCPAAKECVGTLKWRELKSKKRNLYVSEAKGGYNESKKEDNKD